MNLVLLYAWEDARIWAHWNHSFDRHLNYPGPVSCFSPPWILSGCTVGGGCRGWWLDGHNILCLLIWQVTFFITVYFHPAAQVMLIKSSHTSSSAQFPPVTSCFTPRITKSSLGTMRPYVNWLHLPSNPTGFSALIQAWLSCLSPGLWFSAPPKSTLPSYIYLNATSLVRLPWSLSLDIHPPDPYCTFFFSAFNYPKSSILNSVLFLL